MRSIEETRRRWDTLFHHYDDPSDLRAALRTDQGATLCNDGLRSICWKAFLLLEDIDRDQWPQKLTESREAYDALRAHFLKYIEHPDDLESTVDPLADDDQSPWQTLRKDEQLRAEIAQDVDRCLQENFFFQERDTKSKLTDVLFIYSKLNPDVGYRQGMHELLAPILWVVDRDSITKKNDDPMQTLLDSKFVEHDSFTLFLCVMQTARLYYEHGEIRTASGQVDVIPIVARCQYLHKEALTIIDHEVAEHLHAVDVLPQIFLTRWMRLLFGREFPFDDVLMMWDLLFAHGLRSDLVDFTCIAMLLRIRWQLLEADYSGALSLLLRYPSPQPQTPQSFVHDALYLEQNPTAEGGCAIIAKYSGRAPESSKRRGQMTGRPSRKALFWDEFTNSNENTSPTRSPARNSPKSLEALFQDVSKGIQQRTESWGVAKAVRGAVTEARRNMQTMHYEPGLRYHPRKPDGFVPPRTQPATLEWEMKLQRLEERNKTLAGNLQDALNNLHTQLDGVKELDPGNKDAISQALNQAELVQSCLADSSLPLDSVQRLPEIERTPQPTPDPSPDTPAEEPTSKTQAEDPQDKSDTANTDTPVPSAESGTKKPVSAAATQLTNDDNNQEGVRATPPRPTVRPSLADSGFSWMLGGSSSGRNLSGFVSSVSVPPEQARHQDSTSSRGKASPLFGQAGDEDQSAAEHDELLAMSSLRGSRGPL
ncbi:hypothetical protein N7474_009973 [Penicillium riverlandense]|uniref:uncharacterized protein n=1 Tax=Penicillium riverlandense TaxID=1903569 RepID=UPI002549BD05|nr:uncharacterized protein N7474_009973 [Penicillium riverlandense]KAJ5808704.1 hypothetical protein N7474_009973 [Penicillium riverlandense]